MATLMDLPLEIQEEVVDACGIRALRATATSYRDGLDAPKGIDSLRHVFGSEATAIRQFICENAPGGDMKHKEFFPIDRSYHFVISVDTTQIWIHMCDNNSPLDPIYRVEFLMCFNSYSYYTFNIHRKNDMHIIPADAATLFRSVLRNMTHWKRMGSACVDSVRVNLFGFNPAETSAMEEKLINVITAVKSEESGAIAQLVSCSVFRIDIDDVYYPQPSVRIHKL